MIILERGGDAVFLHLGNDVSIRTKDIISIFDYGILPKSFHPDHLVDATEEGQGRKSLVLTEHALYISALSSLTLKRRAEMVSDMEENSRE